MLNGIDIFHGDEVGPEDLTNMVKNNSLYFIFIKATTGVNGKDPKFTNNWNMARKAGLICGAYHFFWPATDASLQAINFVTQYKLVNRAGVLPPVVDIEWTKTNKSQTELWGKVSPPSRKVQMLREYLEKIESLINVKPIIYTANSFWEEFITPVSTNADHLFFSQYKLWIADPNANGKLPTPWRGTTPLIIQNHLGEMAPPSAPLFARLDNDVFKGDLKGLLNTTLPGFTLMKGFPFSLIVKDIQAALQTAGNLTNDPDGFFGKNTFDAVTSFQIANGLVGNGIVDAQTWNKILG